MFPLEIETLARLLVDEAGERKLRVVTAESCTGGLVAAALTEIAGSSAVVDCGFVTYSNSAKHKMLGVPTDMIDTLGAVSAATAWAMAQGALKRSEADVAVAISGIAGPDGGSAQKPVGLVVFARAHRNHAKVEAEERQFEPISRSHVRYEALKVALELLLPDADEGTLGEAESY